MTKAATTMQPYNLYKSPDFKNKDGIIHRDTHTHNDTAAGCHYMCCIQITGSRERFQSLSLLSMLEHTESLSYAST